MMPRLKPHMHLLAKPLAKEEATVKQAVVTMKPPTPLRVAIGAQLHEKMGTDRPTIEPPPKAEPEHARGPEPAVGRTKSRLDVEVRRAYARQVVTPQDTVVSIGRKVRERYGRGLDGAFVSKLMHDVKGRKRRSDWKGRLPSEVPLQRKPPTPEKVAEIEAAAAAIVGPPAPLLQLPADAWGPEDEAYDEPEHESRHGRAPEEPSIAELNALPQRTPEDDIRAAADLLKGAIPGLAAFTMKVAEDGAVEVDWTVRVVSGGKLSYR